MDSESEEESSLSSEEITRGILEMQKTAAAALKRIESIYSEVMGCEPYDDTYVQDTYSSESESNLNNTYSSFLFDESESLTVEENLPNNCHNYNFDINKLCKKCRNVIAPPGTVYMPIKNSAKDKENLRCNKCSGSRKNSSVLNSISKSPIVEHPGNSNRNAGSSNNNNSNKTVYRVKHKCALKATIPVPFKMTLREAEKQYTKELKKQQLKEKLQQRELEELNKKIHSNPAPGHIYLPLFQNMVKNNERKKLQRKEHIAAKLRDTVKPFTLSDFKSKKLQRTTSVPNLSANESPFVFRAKPAPQKILSKEISEKIKNHETVRKLHIAQRAKEMLEHSALPFSERPSFRRTLSVINLNSTVERSNTTAERNNTKQLMNKTYKKVPCDLSREQCKQIMKDWNQKIEAVEKLTVKKCKERHEREADKYSDKCKKFLASQAFPFYDLPVRMTASAMLKEQEMRKELEEKETNEKLAEERKKKITEKEKESKKEYLAKLKASDPTLDQKREIQAKLQCYKAERLLRQQEYDRELEEMMQRIKMQPLLIERQTQNKKTSPKSAIKKQSESHSTTSIEDDNAGTPSSRSSSASKKYSCSNSDES